MNKKELWQSTLAELELNLSRANFSAWFSNTRINKIKKQDDRLLIEVAVANPYVKNTIESRYLGQIKEILDRLSKKKCQVSTVIKEEMNGKNKKSGPLFDVDFKKEKQKALQKAVIKSRLRADFTFSNFAVSSSNEVAYAAAKAVAKDPGKTYNLLFLYGGVGVGKTHLTQAIGHQILNKNPSFRIVYATSEEFTNEIVEAIQKKSTQSFRKKYRSAKALLIDDIQFIAGKDTVQEEFFHTFNAVHAEGGQIVLTSDRTPHEISDLEDRLRSRFEGGLTIDVQEPNFELRTAILLIKAKQRGATLPMEAAQLIAENIKSTRRLEGFLTKLITVSSAKKKPITPSLCKSILKKLSKKKIKTKRVVRPAEVINKVARYFDLKISQIKGPRRAKPIVYPRQIAMYLIREEIGTPYMEVGRLFGGRDHTTVMYAVDKIDKLIEKKEELQADIEKLREEIFST